MLHNPGARRRTNRKNGVDSYGPSLTFIKTMCKLLLYYDDLDIGASVDKKHKRYLDKEKVQLLNECIFPSMANVVYFFVCMSKYPQLQTVFENDIKDLLGVRREKPDHGNYGFILSDLLESILALGIKDRFYADHQEMISVKDFRLRLISILYEICKVKVCLVLKDVLKNPALQRTAEEEFNRTLAWTTILADGVDQSEDSKPPHRTIRFDTKQLREDGEVEDE